MQLDIPKNTQKGTQNYGYPNPVAKMGGYPELPKPRTTYYLFSYSLLTI